MITFLRVACDGGGLVKHLIPTKKMNSHLSHNQNIHPSKKQMRSYLYCMQVSKLLKSNNTHVFCTKQTMGVLAVSRTCD